MELKPGESLEDLQYKGLKIIQRAGGYRFTSDAVFLAGLTDAKPTDEVVDLGTGSGVIALLLAARTGARVTGVELQPSLADAARRSVAFNGLEDRVSIVRGDLKTAHKTLGANRFDVAVSNPPYYKRDGGFGFRAAKNAENPEAGKILESEIGKVKDSEKEAEDLGGNALTEREPEAILSGKEAAITEDFRGNDLTERELEAVLTAYSERELAKFELAARLVEVIRAARSLLKFGGSFFVVWKSERLTDLLSELRSAGMEPKRLVQIQSKPNSGIESVIVKAVKGGRPGLRFDPPIVVRGFDGAMTKQAKEIYHVE